MHVEEKVFFFPLIAVVFLFCSFHRFGVGSYRRVSLTANIYKLDTVDGKKSLLIRASLSNISPDTFTYMIMSCVYPFKCNVDERFFTTVKPDCEKNILEFVRIPPRKAVEEVVRLFPSQSATGLRNNSFSIGTSLMAVDDIVHILNKRGKNIVGILSESKTDLTDDSCCESKVVFMIMDDKGHFAKFDALVSTIFLSSNWIQLK